MLVPGGQWMMWVVLSDDLLATVVIRLVLYDASIRIAVCFAFALPGLPLAFGQGVRTAFTAARGSVIHIAARSTFTLRAVSQVKLGWPTVALVIASAGRFDLIFASLCSIMLLFFASGVPLSRTIHASLLRR